MGEKLVQAGILALALSADTFLAGFSYGAGGVKIPRASMWILNLICGAVLGGALFFGALLGNWLPGGFAKWACFALLFVMGLSKVLDSVTKNLVCRWAGAGKKLKISLFSLSLVLTLYADPDMADIDGSKTLSPREASALALALSLDAMAAGFGSAMESGDILPVLAAAVALNFFALLFGGYLGGRLSGKFKPGISWLGGALLMIVATLKLL